MKNKILFAALSSCLIFSPCSLAHSPYISAQMGYFFTNYDSDNGFAARAALGYLWNKTPKLHLGVETGFVGFQTTHLEAFNTPYYFNSPRSANYMNIHNSRKNLDILGVLEYFVTQRFDFFVKLGAGYQWNHIQSITSGYPSATSNGSGFKSAFGIGYDITPSFNINLERSMQLGTDSSFIQDTNSTFRITMLGLRYTFCNTKPVV